MQSSLCIYNLLRSGEAGRIFTTTPFEGTPVSLAPVEESGETRHDEAGTQAPCAENTAKPSAHSSPGRRPPVRLSLAAMGRLLHSVFADDGACPLESPDPGSIASFAVQTPLGPFQLPNTPHLGLLASDFQLSPLISHFHHRLPGTSLTEFLAFPRLTRGMRHFSDDKTLPLALT